MAIELYAIERPLPSGELLQGLGGIFFRSPTYVVGCTVLFGPFTGAPAQQR